MCGLWRDKDWCAHCEWTANHQPRSADRLMPPYDALPPLFLSRDCLITRDSAKEICWMTTHYGPWITECVSPLRLILHLTPWWLHVINLLNGIKQPLLLWRQKMKHIRRLPAAFMLHLCVFICSFKGVKYTYWGFLLIFKSANVALGVVTEGIRNTKVVSVSYSIPRIP